MRRPSIGAKNFKLSLDKGNKFKEGHGGLPRGRALCVVRRKERGGGSVRKNV